MCKKVVESVTRSTGASLGQCDMHYERFTNYRNFIVQSSEQSSTNDVAATTEGGASLEDVQTVTFIDNEAGVLVDDTTTFNPVALVDGTEDLSLGQFLSRPTLIDTTTWTTADLVSIKSSILPWSLFLNNTVIKKKIDNYAFLRAKLHIKVVLNGTPFQYGALRLCYSPLEGIIGNKVRADQAGAVGPTLTPYSQQPGFYVYPQANSGGEMVLPFFYHRNWVDITTAASVQALGTLRYIIFTPLRTAVTSGTTTVSIRTYAWMSDVHLMGSSSKLAMQADEYGTGPVSLPASAIADAASALTKLPVIGRFMRATEIGASAVSKMASLFGYTNVPVIENVHGFQPMNAPMLASAQIGVPVQKLTLDPKQELAIDPSPHGIGSTDELSLPYLKQKESYFGATSWATTDAADTLLFTARVTPVLMAQSPVNDSVPTEVARRVWHTPLSWLSTMFLNWRGDIIIRVKVVCTKFHKGRLKISYDPINDISATNPTENAVYTQILDIGENDDVEIRIPYHQALAWCKMRPMLDDNWIPGTPPGAFAPTQGQDNGLLTLRVLTSLTAPVASTIGLIFFIRGAENFELANPVDRIKGLIAGNSAYQQPSFFAVQADDKTDVLTTCVNMGPPALTNPDRYSLNFGESCNSLRSLVHRANVTDVVPYIIPATTSAAYLIKNYLRMPYTPGYNTAFTATLATKVLSVGNIGYAYNDMPLMPYVTSPFVGYRGGTNVFITPSTDQYSFMDDIRIARITDPNLQSATTIYGDYHQTLAYGANSNVAGKYYNMNSGVRGGISGMATTSNRTNSTLSINIPDLNEFNFSLFQLGANSSVYLQGNANDGTNAQGARLCMTVKSRDLLVDNGQDTITVVSEASAGPDFTCLFFLCVPTMDYMVNQPTAP